MNQINVRLQTTESKHYKILIGYNILETIAKNIRDAQIAGHYIIIADDCVARLYGSKLTRALCDLDLNAHLIDFPAGEKSKSFESVVRLSKMLIELGADRKSALIALGGGVTGDLAGFLASIYMRGIPVFQVPTTLMAQVDSSIGGKTGINLPGGKNLLGTFHQPEMVLTDIKFLETLPDNEYRNGLAEVVKYGVIRGEPLFGKLEKGVGLIQDRNSSFLDEIITASCRIKADIVSQDDREKDLRRILNFGHTIGHALEAISGYTISHGACVSLGMIGAARLSERLYGMDPEEGNRIEELLNVLGLKNRIASEVSTNDILSALRRDKKKEGDNINFVMLRKIGQPFVVGGLDDQVIRETIDDLRG
jgi:3-dehydroquinate synthase